MAITTVLTRRTAVGDCWQYEGVATLTGTWLAAGVTCTPTQLGCDLRLDNVRFQNKSGYVSEYDYTASKVLLYQQKDPAAAGGADIPLSAVPDSTDLTTTPGTLKFVAKGKGTVAA